MLFPGTKQKQAGKKIGEVVKQFDASVPPQERQVLINGLLQKHFGTADNPNTGLIPNVPAQEKSRIMDILKKEIMAQGRDTVDPAAAPSLKDIQGFKIGAGDKAHYDKSITSGEEKLWRNINGAYNGVTTDAAPALSKWNKQYGAATAALKQHGGGITGAVHQALTGGGALGWGVRAQFVYPAVQHIINALSSSNATPINPNQGSPIPGQQ